MTGLLCGHLIKRKGSFHLIYHVMKLLRFVIVQQLFLCEKWLEIAFVQLMA